MPLSFNWLRCLALLGAMFATAPAAAQSLDDMAGQMILIGFSGKSVDDPAVVALRAEIASGGIGGIMYLKTNVASLKAVRAMNAAFLAANPALPPFISLDQEGGAVQRLTPEVGFMDTPSAAAIAGKHDQAGALAIYEKLAKGLADNGFNLNFGPVADVNINKQNPIIAKYGRAYSDNALEVLSYDFAFIDAHHQHGVLTAIKHYPGHGSSTGDTHEGFVDVTDTWQEAELTVFRNLVRLAPVDMVMVGHLYNANFAEGDDKLPASLSPVWIEKKLRGELGFDGVVITDDMEMGAVRQHYELRDRIVRAVRAGVDILLFSNTARPRASIGKELRAILVAEAQADRTFRTRIEQSYARIVRLKRTLGP